MIELSPIVKDTRTIRRMISQQFEHDSDKYIDYLLNQWEALQSNEPHQASLTKIFNRSAPSATDT